MEPQKVIFNISETIRNIRKAREELREATQKENLLCAPVLTDYSLIPRLYQIFCRLTDDMPAVNLDRRKVFIFIIQYIYAPRTLFGCKMPRGLRRRLAEALGLNAATSVSRWASETMHHYLVYTQFRIEANRIIGGMAEQMKDEGLLR